MRGIVPDAILDRRDKIGFATPEANWLRRHKSWGDQTLASDCARSIPAWNLDAVRTDWEETLAGNRPFNFRIWRWFNLVHWAERWNVTFDSDTPRSRSQRPLAA